MKNSLFLFLCLFNFYLRAHSLTELNELYRIEDNVLINYQGKTYPKIDYIDPLHEELCFVLKDPEQAEIIHRAYFEHIFPHLPKEIEQSFSNALLKVCILFGSNKFSPESALLAALKEEKTDITDWILNHKELFKKFVSQANCPAQSNIIQKKNKVYTVVILTTTASGGNLSVARAIESFLNTKNMQCIVVDVETLARETDLVMLATGKTTYDGIYEKYFQQNNQGMDPLIMRDVISKELGKYIPSCFGLKLKELIRTLNPDLILSTRSYTIDDIPLCTLGIPFRMIHCDYELSFFMLNLYGKIHPEMMKFWLPSFEPEVFRPLFEKTNRMDIYDDHDGIEQLIKKIALITEQSIENIQGQFELLGYPIRPEFYSIEDQQLGHLQEKWDIQDEIPVLISMGINGVGVLEKIFDELQTYSGELSIKYFFVCGKNIDLQIRLNNKNSNKKKFAITGLLSAQEMNELMNLCPLKITKPGGGIISEALETGTYLIIMCSHPWEEANGAKIEKLGLGQRLQANQPIGLQVENCIEKIQNLKRMNYKNIPWKESLLNNIKLIEKNEVNGNQ